MAASTTTAGGGATGVAVPGAEPVHAQSAARAMLDRDPASAALGMALVDESPGRAVVTMTVRPDMLNGFAIAHGGLVFALADTAFAAACNEDECVTVAAGAEISYLRPAREGQTLTATAERRIRTGRSGLYDVRVTDDAGEVVAEFRGRSRTLRQAPRPDDRDQPGTGVHG